MLSSQRARRLLGIDAQQPLERRPRAWSTPSRCVWTPWPANRQQARVAVDAVDAVLLLAPRAGSVVACSISTLIKARRRSRARPRRPPRAADRSARARRRSGRRRAARWRSVAGAQRLGAVDRGARDPRPKALGAVVVDVEPEVAGATRAARSASSAAISRVPRRSAAACCRGSAAGRPCAGSAATDASAAGEPAPTPAGAHGVSSRPGRSRLRSSVDLPSLTRRAAGRCPA